MSIVDTGRFWEILVIHVPVLQILENTGNTSIADTGRFWKILVIPVLQILENTGYTSIADIGILGRIPVNPSFYVYIILKELNIIHTHTSFLLYIT
jgi:hypothetical protein